MIIAEGLTKQFDDFLAVDELNIRVDPGQVLVLLGPNGAGKTTTVRMLTSILVPTRGRAWVAGYDVVTEGSKVRASVGVLTEHHGLYGRMNALEYLDFYSRLYDLNPEVYRPRFTELMNRFGLENASKKRLGEYSKGMRQKLALVRALLHDPPVLLLDEPTSAMDPESAFIVREAIANLRDERRTIILCTHNLAEAELLADRVAVIQKGRIILNDTVEGLKAHLLGPVEYQVEFTGPGLNGEVEFMAGVTLTDRGAGWMRFRLTAPEKQSPELLRYLANHLNLTSYHEAPRSLESAYLQAVTSEREKASSND